MKCYYQVLEVEEEADEDEIKKSYRRLALKWHPDKNMTNLDESKEQFQLIQQAYEVLGDPKERAWYDKHKDSILKGGLGADYKDESLNVYQYFTTSCYKGYGDDEKGFYAVYSEVFKTIAAEDSEFESGSDSDFEIPVFGESSSAYEELVRPFYSHWESYSTKKSYSWLDEFDIRQAGNRKVVRLMEKENKKIRDRAKKERNDEVRALVAFVRKRDKRVQAHAAYLEEKAKANEQKAKERRQKQMLERKAEMETYVESDWSKFSNLEKELQEIEANLVDRFEENVSRVEDEGEEPAEDERLYCFACEKAFKTDKALENHEKSKKHNENLISLGRRLVEEDELAAAGVGSVVESELSSSEEEEEPYCVVCEKTFKTEKALAKHEKSGEHKKKLLASEATGGRMPSVGESELSSSEEEEEEPVVVVATQSKPSKQKNKSAPAQTSDPEDEEDVIDLSELESQRRPNRGKHRTAVDEPAKAKPKRKDRPPKPPVEEVQPKRGGPPFTDVPPCAACQQTFKSRSALHKHLTATGHALAPSAVASAAPKRRGKGGGRGS